MRIHILKNYIGLLFLAFAIHANGQNESDVVRYLDVSPYGTARFESMAGAFGSLGGDLTTLILNPAGSAIYRKSEFVITPGFTFNNVTSSAEGSTMKDSKDKFAFNNAGYVHSSSSEGNRSFHFNYAFAYNKTADFNRNSTVGYQNSKSSMLYSFVDRANGTFVEDLSADYPFTSYLAYEAYLIDEDLDNPSQYLTQPRYEESFNGVRQSNTLEEKGSMGEISANFSIGIEEKIFLGITMSLIEGSYEVNSSFTETTTVDTLLLNTFSFNYYQKAEILGLNFDLGIIFKPENWLRLGLAWNIPHEITVSDDFNTNISSQWKDGEYYGMDSPDGFIEYRIKNPGRWIVSAAVVSGFKGLISVDVEWTNLSKSKISSDDFDFTSENNAISETLRNTWSARIGGEIWAGIFNFRLGYAYRQNPYKVVPESGRSFYNTISGGAGLLTKKGFFINLSLAYKGNGKTYYPYGSEIAPLISDKYDNYELMASMGLKF